MLEKFAIIGTPGAKQLCSKSLPMLHFHQIPRRRLLLVFEICRFRSLDGLDTRRSPHLHPQRYTGQPSPLLAALAPYQTWPEHLSSPSCPSQPFWRSSPSHSTHFSGPSLRL